MFDLFVIYVSPTAEVPRGFSWRMVRRSRPPLLRHCPAGAWALCGGRGGPRNAPGEPRAVALCRRLPLSFWPQTSVPSGTCKWVTSENRGRFPGFPPLRCNLYFYLPPRTKKATLMAPRASSSVQRQAFEAWNEGRVLERKCVRRRPRSR